MTQVLGPMLSLGGSETEPLAGGGKGFLPVTVPSATPFLC